MRAIDKKGILGILFSIVLVLVLLNPIPTFGAPPVFNDIIIISQESGFRPVIAASGNFVYVVWEEASALKLRISDDNGQTFGASSDFATSSNSFSDVRMVALGNDVYVLYKDNTLKKILFFVSHNNGSSFSAEKQIMDCESDSRGNKKLAAAGNNVYVICDHKINSNDTVVRFVASKDNGDNFDAPKDISPSLNRSTETDIDALGNSVFIVWVDLPDAGGDNIVFVTSSDSGDNFSQLFNLDATDNFVTAPQIASSGASTSIAWESSAPSADIVFTRHLGGASFDANSVIATDAALFDMKAAGNDVYVSYEDFTPAGITVLVANDAGMTFNSPLNLSSTLNIVTGELGGPENKFVISGSKAYLIADDSGGTDIFLFVLENNGSTLSSTINLSSSPGNSKLPQVAASGDSVYVVWWEEPVFPSLQHRVFFRAATPTPCNIDTTPSQNTIISSSCTVTSSITAGGSVIVQSGVVVTVPNGITLTIPSGFNITILSGGGILIESGGTVIVVS